MKLTPQKRYVVGVDPGARTGVAVYDRTEEKIRFFKTTDFFGVVPWLRSMVRLTETIAYVEVAAAFMYDRHGGLEDKKRDRYMLNVGGVRREAQLLARMLRLEAITTEEVLPIRKKKWDQHQFQKMTGIRRTANEHERDACRIALMYANKRKELE